LGTILYKKLNSPFYAKHPVMSPFRVGWSDYEQLFWMKKVVYETFIYLNKLAKSCSFGKISDRSSQFHQDFTCSFCADSLEPKNLQSQNVIREKLCKTLSSTKVARKMLVKSTPKRKYLKCDVIGNELCTTPTIMSRHYR